MEFNIMSTPEFKENFGEYGYEEFTKKALLKCVGKKDFGLIGNITLVDAEPSRRIYFKNEEGQEFTIRYFIEHADENLWKASYTLFMMVEDKDGSGHSEAISEGRVVSHYPKLEC